MLAVIGLAVALIALIFMAFRGVNIIIAALLGAGIVALTNGLSPVETFGQVFTFGAEPGGIGAFDFMGRFFLLFVTGAMFGTLMAKSYAMNSIAELLGRLLGPRQALLIVAFTTAILTYGGVVAFVVVFVVYPLGLQLIQRAKLPRRLLVAAMVLGGGTFTLTAMPGTPSIHNAIPTVTLGTDLYAGAVLGLFASAIMLGLGVWYLLREQRRAADWVPPADHYLLDSVEPSDEPLPDWRICLLPMAVVIGLIALPKLLSQILGAGPAAGGLAATLEALSQESVLWPSAALVIGCGMVYLLFPRVRREFVAHAGLGANNSVMPLISMGAIIGFGAVVAQTSGYQQFAAFMPSLDLPPKISAVLSVNVISGVTGSSSGGLGIFMSTLAEQYLAQGVDPAVLHRLVAIACGCFDSLPHSGGVIALFAIMRVTHRDAYKDLGVVTVVIPLIATVFTVALAMLIS
ncbi:MAG: GntP family permease [Cellvibrionales bacterium]|nr:GntP family permease [Cellvibrionales bacterium]